VFTKTTKVKVHYTSFVQTRVASWVNKHIPDGVRIQRKSFGPTVATITLTGDDTRIQSFIDKLAGQTSVRSIEH